MQISNNVGYSILGKLEAGDETLYSSAVTMSGKDKLSVQLVTSGLATGTASLQASLNGSTWVDVADSSDTFTAGGSWLLELSDACAPQYRAKVVLTSGSAVKATGSIVGSVGTLGITADTAGLAGNSIQVILEDSATAGSETVSVVGSVITVGIESGVSTVAQVITAIEADVDAAALIDVAETIAGAIEADSVTLSGGASGNSDITVLAYTV